MERKTVRIPEYECSAGKGFGHMETVTGIKPRDERPDQRLVYGTSQALKERATGNRNSSYYNLVLSFHHGPLKQSLAPGSLYAPPLGSGGW
ncbi:hypothetical protein WISP_142615 [Willisornis vidua]|uniref:Uncharacterized protein n=1 Tax=Willisornis vidua TaxID=1566151 RepID=A0ABQ9CLL6_9PASS|nr:hypothetical protein WISP_142615 [Willisornis vidua]